MSFRVTDLDLSNDSHLAHRVTARQSTAMFPSLPIFRKNRKESNCMWPLFLKRRHLNAYQDDAFLGGAVTWDGSSFSRRACHASYAGCAPGVLPRPVWPQGHACGAECRMCWPRGSLISTAAENQEGFSAGTFP